MLLAADRLRRRQRRRPGRSPCCASPGRRRAARRGHRLHQGLPGHAAADAALPRLFRRQPARPRRSMPGSPRRSALTLYASAFLGEIWRGCIQAIPRGQWEGARALALGHLLAAAPRDPAAGAAHRDPADGRLPGAAAEGHVARLDHRLHRAHARRADGQQRDLPAVHRLRAGGGALLHAVLAAVDLQSAARAAPRSRAARPRRSSPSDRRHSHGIPQARPQRPEGIAALPRRHDVRRAGRRGRRRSA